MAALAPAPRPVGYYDPRASAGSGRSGGLDLSVYGPPPSASLSSDFPPPRERVTPSPHLLDDHLRRLSSSASSDGGGPGSANGHAAAYEEYAMGSGGGGLRPRPSKRRPIVPTAVPLNAARAPQSAGMTRSNSKNSVASSAIGGGDRRAKKMKSNIEDSLLEERLKIANEVLPEDHLEDLMHLPIAPELVSRRQRLRELNNPSSGSLNSPGPLSPSFSRDAAQRASPSPAVASPRMDPLPEDDYPHRHPLERDQNASSSGSSGDGSPKSALAQSKIPTSSRSRAKGFESGSQAAHSAGVAHVTMLAEGGQEEQGPQVGSESWELLQAGGGGKPMGKGFPPQKSPGPARLNQPTTPSKRRPSGDAANKATSQRTRAVTGNLGGKRALSPSNPSKGTPRKASAPLSSQTPKPKRRADQVNGRPRSLSTSSAAVDGPLPPWVTDPGPRMYRVNPSAEDGAEPRHDDLILPAVARQLEKQRLMEEVEGLGLVTEWDREGNPTKVVRNPSLARQPLRQIKGANAEDTSPRIREETENSASPSFAEPGLGSGRRPRPTDDCTDDPRVAETEVQLGSKRKPKRRSKPLHGAAEPRQRKEIWEQGDLADPGTLSEKTTAGEKGTKSSKDKDSHGGGCCRCVIM